MKKLVPLFLALSLLPAASFAESEPWRTDTSNFPISEKKTELNVWTVVTPDVEDMDTNEQTQMYEDLTNVHVNWTVVSAADAVQQKNLSLASMQYPDIYLCMFDQEIVSDAIDQGIFIPLEDLIEEYAPNIRKTLEECPEVRELITAPDGHIYTLFREDDMSQQIPFTKLWAFQPWLKQYKEATGNSDPQTLDEFRAMLEYYRDHDMNGNGDTTDEIPLMGSYSYAYQGSDPMYWILNAFTFVPCNEELAYGDGEKVSFAFEGDAFREGLKYGRDLVKDGLLSDLTYTQDINQFRAVVNVTNPGDMIVGVAAAPYYMRFVTSSIYTTAIEDFWVLEPVKGVNGERVVPSSAGNFMSNWAITAACKDPVAAIKWLDGLCSRETNIYTKLGDEGTDKDWYFTGNYDEFGNPIINSLTSSLLKDGNSTQNRRWAAWGSRLFHGNYKTFALELDPMSTIQRQMDASSLYAQYAVSDGKPALIWCSDSELQTRVKELQTLVTDYARNMYSQFLLGAKDIYSDKDWAEYEEGLKAAGVEEYCELLTQYWYGNNF